MALADILARLMGGQQPMAPFPAPIPGMGDLSPEEIAAASQPAGMFAQPQMGGAGPGIQRALQMAQQMRGGMQAQAPFDRGAAPLIAPGISGPGQFPRQAPVGGDAAVTSLDGGAIPLPRPDPRRGMEASSRGQPAPEAGAPMSLAPPAPISPSPMAAPQGMGGGFRMPSSALLLALGGGMAGAPSFGTAMRRGFSNAAGVAAQDDKRISDRELLTQNQTNIIKSFQQAGAKPYEITAALASKDAMDELAKKYLGKGEAAPSGYQKAPDGTLKFIPGGPADPTVRRALGERNNAPPGYRWVDEADPNKGLVAIPGGPAEKITPEVSSRIGLADSFLGQLPKIRETLSAGGATGPMDAFMAKIGQGRAGEVKRQIDSGAEALLRNLTGAGMSQSEASDYAGRYKLQPWDTVESITSKMNQLERELQFVKATVTRGRSTTPTVLNGKLVIGDTEAPSSTASTRSGKTKSGITYEIE